MAVYVRPLAAESTTPFDALVPLRFPTGLRLTPEQFALLCAENREAVLELAADGRVLAMTPTGSETGGRNSELAFQLQRFARSGTTWKAFDSSTGFRLPDNSVLSPNLVVGLASTLYASPSDEGARALTALRSKMATYQANGARLGWLLIPHQHAVEVEPASGDPQRYEGIAVLKAGPEFPDLQLGLEEIWAG